MSFSSKVRCDADSCNNELIVDAYHPSDAEIWLDDNQGKWLFDDCDHYCPEHALEAAQELDLEYSAD